MNLSNSYKIQKTIYKKNSIQKNRYKNISEFKSKKTRKNLIIYAFLTLFCIAFLLLLSASTSPLYKDLCDGDSSIFIFFGKAITLGKDAYRDYFDHKGPILFYINALGYFLTKSKVGVSYYNVYPFQYLRYLCTKRHVFSQNRYAR